MTEKGYAVIQSLLSHYPGIVAAVISSRDKGIAKDYFEEISELCRNHNIDFHEKGEVYSIRTDYVLAVAWRWLIDVGSARLMVLHDSLLPRYLGFNLLVTALIKGDTKIGATALYGAAQYDRGGIIAQSSSRIAYPIRIREAIKVVIGNYQELAVTIGEFLSRDQVPTAKPQDLAHASYSLWRDEEDYFVDWSHPAEKVKRTIDALGDPYKGAAARLDGRIVRILDAEVIEDLRIENRTAGKVIFLQDARPVVVCGEGLLKITDLVDDEIGTSLLPLSRFRIRFKGRPE